jgi:hypothetical protein
MRNAILISLLLVACGDNQVVPDARRWEPPAPPDLTDVGTAGCADFDINVTCPPPPDASMESDAGDDLDPDTKAACCHALLDGTPPNHACGYPPGLCKNGMKDLFCVGPDGRDAKFTLCNP